MQWSGDPATIGFNADGGLFENHPLSETLNSSDIACQRFPETVWNNVVYQLAGRTHANSMGIITCKWVIFISVGKAIAYSKCNDLEMATECIPIALLNSNCLIWSNKTAVQRELCITG